MRCCSVNIRLMLMINDSRCTSLLSKTETAATAKTASDARRMVFLMFSTSQHDAAAAGHPSPSFGHIRIARVLPIYMSHGHLANRRAVYTSRTISRTVLRACMTRALACKSIAVDSLASRRNRPVIISLGYGCITNAAANS